MVACTYCGCAIENQDPLFLSKTPGGEPAAQYCNYGCLAAHIDDAELTTGTSCEWTPAE
ncbi:hypothetical protein ACFQJ5_04445 [Halomicroarcula sp. GCM10025324]|uniref:hypothetical protein n=1 Tax=Haloarcula TaxID=2237 RepID=UPI0023E841D7|nr:hypothetical protein [Halomicroarcula sp. ZS-22-S1]